MSGIFPNTPPPNLGYEPKYKDEVVWIRGSVGLTGIVCGGRAGLVEVETPRGVFHEYAINLAPQGSALADAAEAMLTKYLMTPAGQEHQRLYP